MLGLLGKLDLLLLLELKMFRTLCHIVDDGICAGLLGKCPTALVLRHIYP